MPRDERVDNDRTVIEYSESEVPLTGERVKELTEFWRNVFEMSFKEFGDVLWGLERAYNRDVVYAARAAGELSGTSHLTVSRAMRGRGIAARLCGAALEGFEAGGGRALFLATSNPAAARIYGRLGWRKLPGTNVMVNVPDGRTPEEFLVDYWRETGLAVSDEIEVAPATVAARVPMVPLLVTPHDWQVLDANVKIHSTRYASQTSCMSLYPRYDEVRAGGKGEWFTAATREMRVVGLATARVQAEGACRVDAFTHAAFDDVWERLVGAATAWAGAHGAKGCCADVCVEDAGKRARLEALGFREAGPAEGFRQEGRMLEAVRVVKEEDEW